MSSASESTHTDHRQGQDDIQIGTPTTTVGWNKEKRDPTPPDSFWIGKMRQHHLTPSGSASQRRLSLGARKRGRRATRM
jgi:lipoprotein-anchoring transpeptidase ErfK/SrfK